MNALPPREADNDYENGSIFESSLVVTVSSMPPTAAAKEIQWLVFRSAREAGRLTGQMNRRGLDLTDEKPEGVELPEFQNDRPLFGRSRRPKTLPKVSAFGPQRVHSRQRMQRESFGLISGWMPYSHNV